MLKRRAFAATLWSGGDLLLRQGVQFATTLILARLLAPIDFGVVAILMLFIGVGSVLADGGFSAALIQRQDADHVDESTVFWCNLGLGVVVAGSLVLASPFIADHLRLPVLEPLLRLSGLVVLAGASSAVHVALLAKSMDFRTMARAGAIAALLSSGLAVILAWRSQGVWALAWQAVAMSVCNAVLLWRFHRWRPLWRWSAGSLRSLGSFSGYHLGSTMLEMLYSRLYALLLGREFGPAPVGYYSNADYLRQAPTNLLGSIVGRVALPMFSSVGQDSALLRRGVQVGLRLMMLLNAPLMLAGVALAEPLVVVVLGVQWKPAAPIFRVLCLAGLLYPLHLLNLQVLMAQGYAGLMFRIELAKKAVGLSILLYAVSYGVMGIAVAQVVYSVVALLANTYYTGRMIGYGLLPQVRDSMPVIAAAAIAAALAYWSVSALGAEGPLLTIGWFTALMLVIYVSLVLLTGNHAWRDLAEAFGQKRRSSF